MSDSNSSSDSLYPPSRNNLRGVRDVEEPSSVGLPINTRSFNELFRQYSTRHRPSPDTSSGVESFTPSGATRPRGEEDRLRNHSSIMVTESVNIVFSENKNQLRTSTVQATCTASRASSQQNPSHPEQALEQISTSNSRARGSNESFHPNFLYHHEPSEQSLADSAAGSPEMLPSGRFSIRNSAPVELSTTNPSSVVAAFKEKFGRHLTQQRRRQHPANDWPFRSERVTPPPYQPSAPSSPLDTVVLRQLPDRELVQYLSQRNPPNPLDHDLDHPPSHHHNRVNPPDLFHDPSLIAASVSAAAVNDTLQFTSSITPRAFLDRTIQNCTDLLHNDHLIGPCPRTLIGELLSDCRSADQNSDIFQECTWLSANATYITEQLLLDESLKEKIEEYQLMRFHNYILAMGNAVPETQQYGLDFLKRVQNRLSFDGGKWEYVAQDVLRDGGRLHRWEEEDRSGPRPRARVLDAVMQPARQCGDVRWRWIIGPLVEYGERMKQPGKLVNIYFPGPDGKFAGTTNTMDDLVDKGRWKQIAQRLVRNYHDVPYFVPLAIRGKIRTFQRELKMFQDMHFSHVDEGWCEEEKREVCTGFEVKPWVRSLEVNKSDNQAAEQDAGSFKAELKITAYHERCEELGTDSQKAQEKWQESYDEVEAAKKVIKRAEGILKEKTLVHKESEERVLNIAKKVEALEALGKNAI